MKPEYVTKPQLDDALAAQDQRWDGKLAAALAAQDQRFDAKLSALGNAMLDRIDRVSAEMAQHAKAIQEYVAAQIKIVDEKYADLPGRVAALEASSRP